MNPLIRPEVYAQTDQFGLQPISVTTNASIRRISYACVILMLTVIAFVLNASYARTYHATGWLVVQGAMSDVQTPISGFVKKVSVREGQQVAEGDPIAEVVGSLVAANGDDAHASVASALASQESELQSSILALRLLSEKKTESLTNKIRNLQMQHREVVDQLARARRRVSEVNDLILKIQPAVVTGNVSAVQNDQERTALSAAEAEAGTLVRAQLDLEEQEAAARSELDSLPATLSAQLAENQRLLWSVRQQLTERHVEGAVLVRAPRSGVVTNLVINDNQMINSGSRIVSIMPQAARFLGETWLPSEAIGLLKTGDRVRVRYDAFPYRRFGSQPGTLAEVTNAVVMPSEVSARLGRQISEPMYRVMIDVNASPMTSEGVRLSLKPGMAFQADIELERRRLADWVVRPLRSVSSDGL